MPLGIKTSFIQALSDRSATEKDTLGDIRWEGNKCYKYVQYNDGSAVAAVVGQAAYYYLNSGYEGNQVTSDLSDSDEVGAGILMAVLGDGEYGWVQIKGFATMSIAFESGTDGSPLTPTGGTTDGNLNVAASAAHAICGAIAVAANNSMMCDFLF